MVSDRRALTGRGTKQPGPEVRARGGAACGRCELSGEDCVFGASEYIQTDGSLPCPSTPAYIRPACLPCTAKGIVCSEDTTVNGRAWTDINGALYPRKWSVAKADSEATLANSRGTRRWRRIQEREERRTQRSRKRLASPQPPTRRTRARGAPQQPSATVGGGAASQSGLSGPTAPAPAPAAASTAQLGAALPAPLSPAPPSVLVQAPTPGPSAPPPPRMSGQIAPPTWVPSARPMSSSSRSAAVLAPAPASTCLPPSHGSASPSPTFSPLSPAAPGVGQKPASALVPSPMSLTPPAARAPALRPSTTSARSVSSGLSGAMQSLMLQGAGDGSTTINTRSPILALGANAPFFASRIPRALRDLDLRNSSAAAPFLAPTRPVAAPIPGTVECPMLQAEGEKLVLLMARPVRVPQLRPAPPPLTFSFPGALPRSKDAGGELPLLWNEPALVGTVAETYCKRVVGAIDQQRVRQWRERYENWSRRLAADPAASSDVHREVEDCWKKDEGQRHELVRLFTKK